MTDAPRELSLPEKLVALHRSLTSHQIGHAFGGALALAYYTNNPRATADIDINLALPPSLASAVLACLSPEVSWDARTVAHIERDEQVRLWWGRTPLDLFFRASDFHDGVAARAVWHPFGQTVLPFLSADDLAIFKALFNRPKDWLDIAEMHAADSFDLEGVVTTLLDLVGPDARIDHLRELGDQSGSTR